MSDPIDPSSAPLSPHERAQLEAWDAPVVRPGLADRVLARLADAPAQVAPPRRWRSIAVGAAAAVTVGLGGVVAMRWHTDAVPGSHGAMAPTARQQIALGRRGIAVGEAGAALSWDVAPGPGAATVAQAQGDVFYRVEPGGPFVVTTPVGEVRVTGTCFRVDIATEEQMKNRYAAAIGGAVGALATVAVVTIYEGQVVVAGPRGEVTARAGDRVTLVPGAAPTLTTPDGTVASTSQPPLPPAEAGRPAPPTAALATLSHAELLAAAEAQRAQLAGLEAEVGRLRAAGPPRGDVGAPDHPWFDPGPEGLKAWAAECRVRFDTPPMMQPEPIQLDARSGAQLGVSDPEREALNQALAASHRGFAALVHALYLETTGDTTGADSLSLEAMAREIEDKNGREEADAVRKHIAEERAGLVAAPTAAALAAAAPVERYLRALAAIGGDVERAFAAIIGPARARALRASDEGPFGWHMEMAGCRDADGSVR